MNKSKSQTRREDIATGTKPVAKKTANLKNYKFRDGMKVQAKDYSDALAKRNKMIEKSPMSKDI